MSSDVAIVVQNIYKCYEIYDKPHHRLLQMLHRGHRQFFREFWAVKNVSMEVRKGETVGIIGRNGSGKSTLLQMICGTLNSTKGTIETNGRIAALLELGSGFNPEFTGRENVYLKSSILGLTSKEIDARFASIAEFAEIGDFMEQPVRTYSSGMMVRLAFAVAISVEPQILIVDEALAVGDERFQRKCFSRIEAIKKNGATILFVSHAGGAIVSLCDRGILLDKGEKIIEGLPKKIVGDYQRLIYAPKDKQEKIRNDIIQSQYESSEVEEASTLPTCPDNTKATNTNTKINRQNTLLDDKSNNNTLHRLQSPPEDTDINLINKNEPQEKNNRQELFVPTMVPTSTIIYEPNGAVIENVKIRTIDGRQVNGLIHGRTYIYEYLVNFSDNVSNVRFGMLIKTKSGFELGGGVSASSLAQSVPFIESGSCFKISFKFIANLNTGNYFLNAGLMGQINDNETYLHRIVDACMFRILPEADRNITAIVDFGCFPQIERIS